MLQKQATSRRSIRPVFLLGAAALFATALGSALLQAQSPAPATVWDGVYSQAQAARGMVVFAQSCERCHSLSAQGDRPLAGDRFWQSNAQKTVADLIAYITATMPNGNPGSLSAANYLDVATLILQSNGFPAGDADLVADRAAAVRIIPKDGSGELPANTLVGVVGCLAREGNEWVLTHATAPERVDATGPRPDDATRPLGERRTALKFILTRLDQFVGQRMAVSGMLMGAGGVDGLNVTTIERVADRCP